MKIITRVLSIIALLSLGFVSGCKKDSDPGIVPTVLSTDPITNELNRAVNSKISATFSVAMDPATITASSFTLTQGTTNVAGMVAYTGTTATFTPAANLAPNAVFTATISAAAKAAVGSNLAKDYSWSFTSSSKTDVIAPTITLTAPINNATAVVLTSSVLITFSEAMDPASITTFTVALRQGTSSVAGAVTYSANVATLKPTLSLLPNTVYTATVTTGVSDMASNALATNYTFAFTTGNAPDTTAPLISSTDPANNATGVLTSKVVAIVFSEAMTASTINGTTFKLSQANVEVAGTVAYTGTTATFTPTVAFTSGLPYKAVITTGAKDVAGNALAANTEWNFVVGTLDITAPLVSSNEPLNNATSVLTTKLITAVFSKPMNASTINGTSFLVKKGSASVSGVVTYVGNTATFTPASPLDANSVYTATINTGAKDLAGNALASNMVWSFTTAVNTTTLAPVDLGAAANYVILAKTAISNISLSAITGDLGLSPAATSYVTGFSLTNATGYATASQITGKIYAADMADPTPINLTTAVNNMITAYTDAAGRPTPDFLELGTGNIGGLTLIKGLYKWTNTVTLPSSITISGGSNDVWIFQIAGDLTLSNAVNITLSGGAQAKNIFWQVAGTVNIGTTAHFEGIILSQTGITLQTGASLKGRALAQSAVILDSSTVTKPN